MNNIRVTYAGLISLLIGFSSIVTGTIFTLIVTRQLTQDEFGTWGLIGSLVGYVLVTEPIISYWSTREIARGKKSGKTGIISTGFFSVFGLTIFVILAYFVSLESDASFEILLFGCIIIPVLFLQKIQPQKIKKASPRAF